MVDLKLLDLATDFAWKFQGLTYPNPAVGALICDELGRVISIEAHKRAGSPHAEVEVLKSAYFKITNDDKILQLQNSSEIHSYLENNHNNIFKNCTIYVTLEPCNHFGKTPPCSHLLAKMKFKRVVIGSLECNKDASGGAEFLRQNGIRVDLLENSKCKALIEPFNLWQRDGFVFFKLAMSLNGVVDGGVITSKESRELVHKLRDRCDLLVIGGNTVRVDRPTLDARMTGGKAPDILIYSKREDFDRSMPLFSIPNRKVFISNSLELTKKYKFIMIEGAEGMLKATTKIVNHYLIFRSPNFKTGNHPNLNLKLKELYSQKIGKDRFGWFKRSHLKH